jgi:hypothetical protein
VAFFQDEQNFVADKVFPMVPVVHQTDQYFVWNIGDFFRDDAQQRADGVESAGTGMNLTTQSYTAAVYALHKDIGPQVRANADPAIDVDVTTTRMLMQKLLIKRDRVFATKFLTTGLWTGTSTGSDITGTAGGTPGTGTPPLWSDDANGDPFTDIATQQTAILRLYAEQAGSGLEGLSGASQAPAGHRPHQVHEPARREGCHPGHAGGDVRRRGSHRLQGGLQLGG